MRWAGSGAWSHPTTRARAPLVGPRALGARGNPRGRARARVVRGSRPPDRDRVLRGTRAAARTPLPLADATRGTHAVSARPDDGDAEGLPGPPRERTRNGRSPPRTPPDRPLPAEKATRPVRRRPGRTRRPLRAGNRPPSRMNKGAA